MKHSNIHVRSSFSQTETKSQNMKTIVKHLFHLFYLLKYIPLKQTSIPVKHSNIHVRSSFFSQTETKSLNQKATATHFPFLLFKTPFLEPRLSLRIRKSLHQNHFISFENAYISECKLYFIISYQTNSFFSQMENKS